MPKDGLPVSLRCLCVQGCRAELAKQIEDIKRTNPDIVVDGMYL
jgi:hypothetical protein